MTHERRLPGVASLAAGAGHSDFDEGIVMTNDEIAALLKLQKDCGIPHSPTQLTYELRLAVSGQGERAYDWSDKPHRLLYDACCEIERLTSERAGQQSAEARVAELEAENARLREALSNVLPAIQHRGGPLCSARYYGDEACCCGATAAQDEARAALAGGDV